MDANLDESLYLSPLHNARKKNMKNVNDLRQNFYAFETNLKNYLKFGSSMCTSLDLLSNNFNSFFDGNNFIDNSEINQYIQAITKLFNNFKENLQNYFKLIDLNLIPPIHDYISKYIDKIESNSKTASEKYNTYLQFADKYCAIPKKNTSNHSSIEVDLISSHNEAMVSDFMLSRYIEQIEKVAPLELTKIVCIFFSQFIMFIKIQIVYQNEKQ